MKIILKIFITIGIIASILMYGCSKEDNSLKVKDFSHSGCKPGQKSMNIAQLSDAKELIRITSEDRYLNLEHVNVYFNCEPGKIMVNANLSDTIITISEEEEKHYVDCICPYDLSFKLGPLNFQHYYFIITHGEAEYTHFTLDYHVNIDTTIEVIPN